MLTLVTTHPPVGAISGSLIRVHPDLTALRIACGLELIADPTF